MLWFIPNLVNSLDQGALFPLKMDSRSENFGLKLCNLISKIAEVKEIVLLKRRDQLQKF